MAMFTGFKPQGLQKIASKMGYAGRMEEFDRYLEDNPEKQREMIVFQSKAQDMARGGVVRKLAEGGETTDTTAPTIQDFSTQQSLNPTLPAGGATIATDTNMTPEQDVATTSGQLTGDVKVGDVAKGTTTKAESPTLTTAAQVQASQASPEIKTATTTMEAAQGVVSQQAQVEAAQQTTSSVSNLEAAQGNATLLTNPVQRKIETGEIITGSANAETASNYTEQIQAATANPTEQATVQGQLATLTDNFDASNPPSWAAGTLRAVQAQMAARGLGASSMAGQAMIQGALEAALPIAQADAQTVASFEAANLSNRQQRAMLAAQQRATFIGQEFDQAFQSRVQNAAKIGDVANMNFTAEQNIALENSRAANTMSLSNLSNSQAMVMAEASALSNLDMSNLSNRQQSAVQNAQSFLQMDMANLQNTQQTDLFKSQSIVQSLLTDQAATNAAAQFNATSTNQTDQFFANLNSTVSTFNSEQANAMERYNAGEENVAEQFNANLKNQREQFNSQNRLVIDQSNAQWRRQVATSDTATINRVNEINAKAILDVSTGAYNNLWQGFRDDMEFAWKTGDNGLERSKDLVLRKMEDEANVASAALMADAKQAENLAQGVFGMASSNAGANLISSAASWVAKLF